LEVGRHHRDPEGASTQDQSLRPAVRLRNPSRQESAQARSGAAPPLHVPSATLARRARPGE
jgi:hypothetical protein